MIINKKLTERKVIWSCRAFRACQQKATSYVLYAVGVPLTTSSSLYNAISEFRVNFRIVVAVSIIFIRSEKNVGLILLLTYMQLICDRLLISQK